MGLRDSIRALIEGEDQYDHVDLLSRICNHDAALQMGFALTYRDVTVEEFMALRILQDERTKFTQEQAKREANFERARAQSPTARL